MLRMARDAVLRVQVEARTEALEELGVLRVAGEALGIRWSNERRVTSRTFPAQIRVSGSETSGRGDPRHAIERCSRRGRRRPMMAGEKRFAPLPDEHSSRRESHQDKHERAEPSQRGHQLRP